MLAIKICTNHLKGDGYVEETQIITPLAEQITLYKIGYQTYKQFQEWLNKYTDGGKVSIAIYGETPEDNDSAIFDRCFVYCTYGTGFIVSQGQIYITQEGKTIESIIVKNPNN